MRFDSQKSFPYPVLRPDIDDYLNAEFQVTVKFLGINNNKQISAQIKVALSSDEIRKQIDSGHAAISVVFSCRDTYFRQAVTTDKYELTKKFDSGQFRGEVVVYPYVVVVKPIKAFAAKGINPEFGQSSFSFSIGEVLAADEPKIVYIDRELFRPVSSILQLVKKESLKGFEWQIAFDEDKLRILLSPEAKEAVDKARNTRRNQAVLINSIYFAAIIEAVQRLKDDKNDSFGHLRWAQVIKQQCHNEAISVESHDAYLIAQRLLKTPLQLVNQYVFGEDGK